MAPRAAEPPAPPVAELRQLAEEAARIGGGIARRAFGGPLGVQRKADGSEVTAADLAAQQAIVEFLHRSRPQDAIIGEETIHDDAVRADLKRGAHDPERIYWAIDPIDGTRNFIRSVPLYACSVAACAGGRPVAGAVYAPQFDQLYSAETQGPLLRQGVPAGHAGQQAMVRTPLVAVPSSSEGASRELVQRWLDRTVLRSLGSTALHLAYVASGAYDAMLNFDGRLWDIAAGYVLVEAVGGRCTTLAGRELFPIGLAEYEGEMTPCIAVREPALLQSLTA